MRTTILSLILLTVAACMRAEVQLQNSEVNSQWRTKTISVKNGGQSPDVIKLLRAFNEALPTWVVGEVLKQADHPAKGTRQSGTASIYEDGPQRLISTRCLPASGARTMATASSPSAFTSSTTCLRTCYAGTTTTLRRRP